MKATVKLGKVMKVFRTLFLISIVLVLLSACERGRDGRPGRAFLSLDWELVPPEYLDAGTPDIPAYFNWGKYYIAYPGFYTLYYEGTVQNGPTYVFYAWEIDYEIWVMSGEPGRPYYIDGYDGLDTYFTVVCNPKGPYAVNCNKMSEADAESTIVEDTGDRIVVLMEKNEYRMKVTYRKVEPRNQSAVDSMQ